MRMAASWLIAPVYSAVWRRRWHPTPLLLPGKSHGRRSLVGYSPWGCQESDTTEWLDFHFSLSCIGEGNGNPLQCSCLENPRDGRAWWAAVYGVASLQQHLDGFLNSEFYKDSKINKSQTFELTKETMLKGEAKVHIIIYHKQYYVIWCLLLILKCSLIRSW